jgi:hypothetical protein
MIFSTFKDLAKSHTSLIFLIPFSFVMIFIGLSNSALQVDEGADTFVSSTILKYGAPYHNDELNSTMEYASIHDKGLFLYRTWLPYYLQAGSLLIFGKTTFAARLPFAFLGVTAAIALYFFTLKLTKKKSVAFLATLFLIASVPTLIYFRTARYIGLPILFTILLLYSYITIYDKKFWNPWPLIITSILYFHTMYVAFVGIILGVLTHFYINRKSTTLENDKQVIKAAIITSLFTLPWLWFIFPVFEKIPEFYLSASDQIDTTNWRFIKNFTGYLFQLNNYIFPFIFIPLLMTKSLHFFRNEIQLCLCCISGLIVVSLMHTIPLQQYIAGSFPLWYILLALIVVEVFPSQLIIRFILTTTLIFTNIINVGPFLSIKEVLKNNSDWFNKSIYTNNVYKSVVREIKIKSVFHSHLLEISNRYQGPLDKIITFFEKNGKPSDSFYIDNEHESFVFYTGMKGIHRDAIKAQDRPNWIILRGDDRNTMDGESSSEIAKNIRAILKKNNYSKITLNAPSIRVNNTYDIQIHHFHSPLLADKIIVYKLVEH